MNLHANAALSLNERRDLCQRVVERDWTVTKAAAAAEVSVRCARKWVGRYRAEGEQGLLDRSSAPRSIPHRSSEERVQAIAALRRLRFTGPEIAETLGMALSTVSGMLSRIGMGKLGRLGFEPAQRYERATPGEPTLHRCQEAWGHPARRRGADDWPSTQPATPPGRPRGECSATPSAGGSCTSRSMTAPAWPTPRFSATRKQVQPSGSYAELEPSTAGTGSRSKSCSRIMEGPTSRPFMPSRAERSAYATSGHDLFARLIERRTNLLRTYN